MPTQTQTAKNPTDNLTDNLKDLDTYLTLLEVKNRRQDFRFRYFKAATHILAPFTQAAFITLFGLWSVSLGLVVIENARTTPLPLAVSVSAVLVGICLWQAIKLHMRHDVTEEIVKTLRSRINELESREQARCFNEQQGRDCEDEDDDEDDKGFPYAQQCDR